jgi:hypothetical protein
MRQGNNPRRPRGRGPRKPHHHQSFNPKQHTFDSNGPEVRVRGNAYQVLEKYLALARDASSSGDRIAAENYLQHAEHYYRIINAYNEEQAERQRQPGQQGQPGQQPTGTGRPNGNGGYQPYGPGDDNESGGDGGEGEDEMNDGEAPPEGQ